MRDDEVQLNSQTRSPEADQFGHNRIRQAGGREGGGRRILAWRYIWGRSETSESPVLCAFPCLVLCVEMQEKRSQGDVIVSRQAQDHLVLQRSSQHHHMRTRAIARVFRHREL
jgi:hypothetical protein